MRHFYGLPSDYCPWTTNPGVQLCGVRDDPRAREILDIGFAVACRAKPGFPFNEVAKGLWANPSQDIDRKPWSSSGPMGLATSIFLYSYEHDIGLSGFANLRIIGHPTGTSPMGVLAEDKLRNLAGECFSVPVIAMVIGSFAFNPSAPWW